MIHTKSSYYRSIKEMKTSWVYFKCALMGSRFAKIGVVISVICAVVLVSTLMLTGVIGGRKGIEDVVIEVDYFDSWNMTITVNSSVKSLSGFGKMEKVLMRSHGGRWVVSLSTRKLDGSSGNLRVRIKLRDGTVLQEGSTTAPFGTVNISMEILNNITK